MQIYLDPWNSDYSPSISAESPEEAGSPEIRLDVETPEWKPVQPSAGEKLPPFAFIDGVRRVESRIILQNGKVLYGLLGSVAAGAVLADQDVLGTFPEVSPMPRRNFGDTSGDVPRRISFHFLNDILQNKIIEHYFITGGGIQWENSVKISPTLEFLPMSVADESIQAPMQKLQQLMRDAEGRLIEQIAVKNPGTLIVADGPLHFPWAKQSRAIGYIKSFYNWYLPAPQIQNLALLPVGCRTPLFLIGGQTAAFPDRFGWFVRLSAPDEGDSPLSGLARLEISSDGGIEKAKSSANHSCALTRYISKKYQDPRSPQNLLPIGALEKTLKHLLGDSTLIKRWIQGWLQRHLSS